MKIGMVNDKAFQVAKSLETQIEGLGGGYSSFTGSKLDPATITADARNQALETSPKESRNKEIAEFYIKYMSEIQRLPWDPNDTMHIDDVYVNLEWVQEKKKPAGTSFDRMQGYTSIFNDTKQGKTPKRILVRGKAGIGKTTFTQKMATDWANAILGSTTCEGILSNYKYLLILNLRSILRHQTLKEAIEMQIPCSAEKEVIEDIMCALNKDRNKVLLVFDGYDEYDPNTSKEIIDIILGRQYPGVCTVITSRPWKAEELMNRRITDGVYEITGLTEDNIHEYVAKFFDDGQAYLELRSKGAFSHSMVESRHAIGKCLIGYLERRKLMSLVKIPIILLFICLMWEGNQTSDTTAVSLPASYTLLYEKLLRLIIRRKNKIEKESEVDKYLEELNDTFLQLGKQALHGLLKPGGGLTFDEGDLQSIPDIYELYSLGLLSRSKVHCNFDVKKEVTFLHKTIQELFAAKYFARTIDNNLDKFLGCFNTLGRLHDMDYVLRFLCGLSETATIKVLRTANALFGKESKYSSWRINYTDNYCKYGEWLQNLLLEHWYAHCPYGTVLPPEIIHSAISWHTVLYIPGFFRHSDPRFQRALWDSIDSAFSSPQTCAVTLTDVTKVQVDIDRYNTFNFEAENENSWHKLLSIFKTCYMSEKLEEISWLIESHTCDVCKCALKNVLSKAPYLRTLKIKCHCKGVLASIPNPGNLVHLEARNINDQDIQVIQQMESLQFISVKGDRLSKDPAPVLGTLPNISHDCTYRYIDIGHIYLGAKGVKLLGRNLRHMPKLYHLGLKSVLKRGPECESSRCTCPRGKDTTQCDICKDVCEAVRELSQGVIHTTYLMYFSFRGNNLAVYHGIKDPLTGLMESLQTVSGYARLNIDMRENGLDYYIIRNYFGLSH
ncbi:uncharacterized protein LOC106162428 [Lingula anatina]|uniref:Uncharacterized protein LOC106162428 n=1 Tax=Lingula anatina TaxID=7574 RepID=A0A1S3IBE1_LINAN|nr:uncharacterized protein LOC106162428 [Lingula anatina]|eukprot:XP_013395176.1 uncharacterized protein LOC106162428 [Lingula anatina]